MDGSFLSRPSDIANYLNKYFINKVDELNNNMPAVDVNNISNSLIKDNIMKDKQCLLKFDKVCIKTVEDILRSCKNKPPGIANLDGKLLKLVAEEIAPPICHIINMSFVNGLCPLQWKRAKITPLLKNKKLQFSGQSSNQPVLSKIMESVMSPTTYRGIIY